MTEPYRSLSLVGGGTCDGCSKLCYFMIVGRPIGEEIL